MARRTFSSKTSWDDMYNYLTYVDIALSLAGEDGDKELSALVAPVQKLLGKWAKLDGDRRDRQRAVIRANALVGLRDLGLDDVTTRLHHAVLGECNQSRTAPLFTRLFPKPLSQVVKLALEAQLGTSRTLLHKLTQAETPAAIRKAHEKPLTDSIAAGEAAIKNREAARAGMQGLATQIAGLRDEASGVLLITEGQLQAIAGKRGLGKSFVDAFFPTAAPAAPKKRPDPQPAAT
jgi:hypothetical protein